MERPSALKRLPRSLSTARSRRLLRAPPAAASVAASAASIGKSVPTIHRNHVVATILAGHLAAPGPAGASRLSLGTEGAHVQSTPTDRGRAAEAPIPPGQVGGCPAGAGATLRPDQTCT